MITSAQYHSVVIFIPSSQLSYYFLWQYYEINNYKVVIIFLRSLIICALYYDNLIYHYQFQNCMYMAMYIYIYHSISLLQYTDMYLTVTNLHYHHVVIIIFRVLSLLYQHACMHVCVYIYIHTHKCDNTHTRHCSRRVIRTGTHVYTHTHTYTPPLEVRMVKTVSKLSGPIFGKKQSCS